MAYTTIDNPSETAFNTKLFTGTGSSNAVTGVGFQPDWCWFKDRDSSGNDSGLFDSVRGVQKRIRTDQNDAENTDSNGLTAFGADGFTVGSGGYVNANGSAIVSWNWKAGTSFSNSSGSNGANLDSSGSVSTTAGFSITSFTGDRSTTRNIYHGLGVVPKIMIFKNRSTTNGWTVYHEAIGNAKKLTLNSTSAQSNCTACFASTTPTSTLFTVGDDSDTNGTSNNMICYAFSDIKGYSKAGSYTGTGSNVFVYTGFKVGWLLVKNADDTNGWLVIDAKRSPANPQGKYIYANSSNSEGTVTYGEFYSNGFGWKGTSSVAVNQSGDKFVYLAFAENPLVTSTGIPATAR
jgi:hypothetical protein